MPPDRQTAPPNLVRVTERRVSGTVVVPDATADAVLRRTVAAHRREHLGRHEWTVFGSQLPRLLAALECAGYTVERVTPDARSASRS